MARREKQPRGVVDTSVLVAGVAGFKPGRSAENPSASLLRDWLEHGTFVWLLTEEVLSEYKAVLIRLGVRRRLVGEIINLLREEAKLRGPDTLRCDEGKPGRQMGPSKSAPFSTVRGRSRVDCLVDTRQSDPADAKT